MQILIENGCEAGNSEIYDSDMYMDLFAMKIINDLKSMGIKVNGF